MYRRQKGLLEVFLTYPGSPYFAKKDDGSWSIPKGEITGNDSALATAIREFEEETGIKPQDTFRPLGQVKQRGGKIVHA